MMNTKNFHLLFVAFFTAVFVVTCSVTSPDKASKQANQINKQKSENNSNYQVININRFGVDNEEKYNIIDSDPTEEGIRQGIVQEDEESATLSSLRNDLIEAGKSNDDNYKQRTSSRVPSTEKGNKDIQPVGVVSNNSSSETAEDFKKGAYRPDPIFKPVPKYLNPKVERYIKLYTVKKRSLFKRGLRRSVHYVEMMKRIFREEGLPEELIYLSAVESNFNYKAISRAKAVGIWQFMSFTGKDYDLTQSWWHDERYDPIKSTRAAARYLKALYKKFDSWELALAAYNSGPNRVRRAIRHNLVRDLPTDYWNLKLPRETRGYVPAFLAMTHIMNNLKKYGFVAKSPLPEVRTAKFSVPGGISLKDVAAEIKTGFQTLKKLNPTLKYQITPGNLNSYSIHIPEKTVIQDEKRIFAALSKKAVEGWLKHKVRKGDTVWDIARAYGVKTTDIMKFNKKLRAKYIRPGMYLLIPSAGSIAKKTASVPKSYRASNQSGTVYKVKKGDTLYKISKLFNTSIKSLVNTNQNVISSRHLLKVGMLLTVN